jgi:hypothetical protein
MAPMVNFTSAGFPLGDKIPGKQPKGARSGHRGSLDLQQKRKMCQPGNESCPFGLSPITKGGKAIYKEIRKAITIWKSCKTRNEVL